VEVPSVSPYLSPTKPLAGFRKILVLGSIHKNYWENSVYFVRFVIFTAVSRKNAVFWDVAQCRSCVNRRFGQMYRLHLQGRKIRGRGTSVSRWLQTKASIVACVYVAGVT
jgi:hypothetical protein